MEKRLGFVGIILEEREQAAPLVNEVISQHGAMIVARMGLPYRHRQCNVIVLIVDATTDELGALTGALGGIPHVSVKAALAKSNPEKTRSVNAV